MKPRQARQPRGATFRAAGSALVLLALAAAPAVAQEMAVVEGSVIDLDGDPVAGARVVYRLAEEAGVFISGPTDELGEYSLELPAGKTVLPVAVITDAGKRIELGPVGAAQATDGLRQQITVNLPRTWNPSAIVQNFPAADRLFLSFVEDTTRVERFHVETQLQGDFDDTGDRTVARFVGAGHFQAIPDVEWGVRLGYAGLTLDDAPDGTGVTDTDLWAKYVMGPKTGHMIEMSFGFLGTLATGDTDEGTGFGQTRSKLFFAVRKELNWGMLTGNAGLRFNGDGEFRGLPLEGSTSGALGFGVIVPWTWRASFIGEATYEGKRFDAGDADARLLAGVNWLLLGGSIRGALALGLIDGAPDFSVLVAYAIEF